MNMWIKKALVYFSDQVEILEKEIKFFGVVMAINFPLYFFIWDKETWIGLFIEAPLRLGATFLCFGLALKDYWPTKFLKFLPLYWYFSLTFCLPFFFTFMTLVHHGSAIWLMNDITVIFFVFILNNVYISLVVLSIGILAAEIVFLIFMPPFHFDLGAVSGHDIFWSYLPAIIIGGMFSYKRDEVLQEKLQALSYLSGAIAHEMRTPLFSLRIGAQILKDKIKVLTNTYRKSQKYPPIDEDLEEAELRDLEEIPARALTTIHQATTIIDLLLINLKSHTNIADLEPISIESCINEALQEYPFMADESSLVNWDPTNDFHFQGNGTLLKYVIFNMIKNSLYHIKEANKGKIFIWLEKGGKYNILHFKDTGKGIPQDILHRLFDSFYSKTKYGTGIGLAFCKKVMNSFGGNITCHSIEGEYIDLLLKFPAIKNNH